MFISALLTVAKKGNSLSIFDRWMDKDNMVHVDNGILLNHEIEWNTAICSNMDGSRAYYTKWSKS